MAITRIRWEDISADTFTEWGNMGLKVYGPQSGTDLEHVVWEGHAAGWSETTSEGLQVVVRVELDPEHSLAVPIVSFAKGSFTRVEPDGYVFDLEAQIEAERQQKESAANAEAAATLALPNGVAPNREQRRSGR